MTGYLARRNPTVKLALLFAVSLATFFLFDPVTPAVLYLLALAGIVIGARPEPRALAAAHLPLLAFALGILLVNALSRPGTVLWQAGAARITVEGLEVGAALGARALLIGILSFGFIVCTDAVALLTSLYQHARLNERVCFALVAGYRMLQQLGGEWEVIRYAQRVRAPLGRHGRPKAGPARFGLAAFALLVMMVRRGERVAQSLEARGLGRGARTVWRPVPLTSHDGWFAVAVLGGVTLTIGVSVLAGVARGPSALFGG